MSFDYNVFTKAELVDFMKKNEKNYKYSTLPYQVMLENKMNKVMKEMEKSTAMGSCLVEQLKEKPKDIEITAKIITNHREWKKLNKEYDKLSDMLFKKNM